MRESSGQMLLISAFMISIMVVTITLMLNNVIYSSNVAYSGFMDQSRYDNIILKGATIDEAEYAYNSETIGNYQTHMADYEKALNNILSLKGRYVDLEETLRNPDSAISNQNPITTPQTKTKMTIYGNSEKVTYELYTGDDGIPPYVPAPQPPPVVDKIILSTSMTSLTTNVDYATLSVVVLDKNGVAIPNKAVQFDNYLREDASGNSIATAPLFVNLDKSTPPPPPATDENGETKLLFMDENLITGKAYIKATVDGKTSNIVEIDCSTPPTCVHNINVKTPTIDTNGNSGKYTLILPLDFQHFTSYNVLNVKCTSYSSNIHIKTAPVYHTSYSTLKDVIVMEVELNNKQNPPFSVTLNFEAKGTCSIDGKQYDRMVTVTVSSDGTTGTTDTPVFTNP